MILFDPVLQREFVRRASDASLSLLTLENRIATLTLDSVIEFYDSSGLLLPLSTLSTRVSSMRKHGISCRLRSVTGWKNA